MVAAITSIYFGEEIYKNQHEKALAYLYFLIKDHPFVDGNKRTASLVFKIVCEINSLEVDYSIFKLDELAIYIEKINEPNHHEVIALLSGVMFKNDLK